MSDSPLDPLPRFVALHEALNAERGWWSDASCLRFSALSAILCPGSPAEVAAAIRAKAGEIRKRAGWFGRTGSNLRFVLSAVLVAHGDDAGTFLDEVKRVGKLFRELGLRRGGIYETMAVLILRQQSGRKPIRKPAVERFQAIYEEMKRHHWWLTGRDDFPVCAVLTGVKGSPLEIGEACERIYQALRERDFSRGDPLQTSANLLCLAGAPPETAAERFLRLAEGFAGAGVAIWRSDYDELAILSFLDAPPERVIERVLARRQAMERLRPKPNRSLTFNLAASIAFLELASPDGPAKGALDVKALLDMQAILNAQQAAAAAATSAAASA